MSHGYRYSSAAEPPPRSPHFVRVVHTIGGEIGSYRCLVKCPRPSTVILRFVCNLVGQWCNLYVSPLALCRHITLKHEQVTTLYTPGTTSSVTIARNSSVHAQIDLRMLTVPDSKAEILYILKLL